VLPKKLLALFLLHSGGFQRTGTGYRPVSGGEAMFCLVLSPVYACSQCIRTLEQTRQRLRAAKVSLPIFAHAAQTFSHSSHELYRPGDRQGRAAKAPGSETGPLVDLLTHFRVFPISCLSTVTHSYLAAPTNGPRPRVHWSESDSSSHAGPVSGILSVERFIPILKFSARLISVRNSKGFANSSSIYLYFQAPDEF